MKDIGNGEIVFAVGAEKTDSSISADITAWLSEKIDRQLKNFRSGEKTICLRIDKDISYFHAQKALAAVAQSDADKTQLATLKTQNPANQ